ncbi:hypothetical protein IV203_029728 [Nitzschia inconspicua]|uniref:Uncharacterized protein n=1 Tax=Nitzschia inconspicua TaxID=303405 RepID=A0A9K3LRA8_9STRA|nr:hypothetical protein IV203_029728 [Nitzschia inconspicua]
MLVLLSCKFLSGCGQRNEPLLAGETTSGLPPRIQSWLLRTGTGSDRNILLSQQNTNERRNTVYRKMNEIADDDMIDDSDLDYDDEGENEYGLDHDPQRQFNQEDYDSKERFIKSHNQDQVENYSHHLKNARGVGTYRDNHNVTGTTDGGDGEKMDQETNGESFIPTSTEEQSLENNTQVALLRHEDPLPERDAEGDSIFPLQQQNENVFQTRQHGDS